MLIKANKLDKLYEMESVTTWCDTIQIWEMTLNLEEIGQGFAQINTT